MRSRKIPLIIDTDPGCDDALAIMLLEKSGAVDVLATTTVPGNNILQQVTNNARFILDLVKSRSPLYSGAEKPLKKELIISDIQGINGLGGVEVPSKVKLDGLAVDKIIEIVKKNPKKITILAIGPLTNIALAFKKDPSLPSLIKELVIMGGAITEPGNKSRVAEFNFFIDPDAAEIVFESSVKKVLIPLDLCMKIPLYLKDFQKLKNSNLYPIIYQMMKGYIEKTLEFENTKGAMMFDPLAAYYLLNPTAYRFEKMDIRVETKGELTRGMSVAERRNWGDRKPNVNVATNVNREDFVSDFLKYLNK